MGNYDLLEQAQKEYNGIELIKQAKYNTKYQTYQYNLTLVEKIY